MRRRRFLLALAAGPVLWADEAQDIRDFFGQAGSALSEGDAGQFMKFFDRAMPGYQTLAANVQALVLEQNVQSSIEVLSDEGTETRRMLTLDWFLQFVEPEQGGATTRRREQAACTVERRGKKWIITAFAPLALFAPPAAR